MKRVIENQSALYGEIILENDEAWHPLPGAPLRFRLRFLATLRLRLGAGSGLPSAGLFCICFLVRIPEEQDEHADADC